MVTLRDAARPGDEGLLLPLLKKWHDGCARLIFDVRMIFETDRLQKDADAVGCDSLTVACVTCAGRFQQRFSDCQRCRSEEPLHCSCSQSYQCHPAWLSGLSLQGSQSRLLLQHLRLTPLQAAITQRWKYVYKILVFEFCSYLLCVPGQLCTSPSSCVICGAV